MEIKQFVFNPFGVNCYILSNSKGEAILIDPSVSNAREQAALTDYLKTWITSSETPLQSALLASRPKRTKTTNFF